MNATFSRFGWSANARLSTVREVFLMRTSGIIGASEPGNYLAPKGRTRMDHPHTKLASGVLAKRPSAFAV